MKSHRKHKPLLPDEDRQVVRTKVPTGKISPDGTKRRLDKLHQAIKTWWMYYEWIEEDKARKQECERKGHKHGNGRYVWSCGWGDGWFRKSFIKATKEMEELWLQAKKDGILS